VSTPLAVPFVVDVVSLAEIVDGNSTEQDVSRVVLAITRTIDPPSWVAGGGDGTIVAIRPIFDKCWRLTIYNTDENIKAIRNLAHSWRTKAAVSS